MGTCWVPLPRHAAKIDEIMKVLWSDYYGAALFGDHEEIACLPTRDVGSKSLRRRRAHTVRSTSSSRDTW